MNNILPAILNRKVYVVIILSFFLQNGFAQTNLITNGGFENGTTGWSVWGATLATTTDAHSGSAAAKVSNRKNPWDAINTNITSIIKSGQSYTLSAWVKIPSPAVKFRA
ncbi:MAG: carbohydrate binding domain-containing protein, partial [Draconibacterium sp.]|nr:carbohydrate binding domain-containing protein [Draconibacterium sp.]